MAENGPGRDWGRKRRQSVGAGAGQRTGVRAKHSWSVSTWDKGLAGRGARGDAQGLAGRRVDASTGPVSAGRECVLWLCRITVGSGKRAGAIGQGRRWQEAGWVLECGWIGSGAEDWVQGGKGAGKERSVGKGLERASQSFAVTSSFVIQVMILNNQSSSHAHTFTRS